MNRSLSSDDLELVLDTQNIAMPAAIKEKLMKTASMVIEMPMDYATYSGDYCWIVSKQDCYAWIMRNQEDTLSLKQRRIHHLHLPDSAVTYTTQLVRLYEKDKSKKDPSVLAISREGSCRYWPSFSCDRYIDSNLPLNHEIVQQVHLLDAGSTDAPTLFVLITIFGTIYKINVEEHGHCSAELIGNREAHGITGRLSNLMFGAGTSAHGNHVNTSLLYSRDNEDYENDAVLITLGRQTVSAYDISNRSIVWAIDTKVLIGDHVAKVFQKRKHIRKSDIQVIALDVKLFREGIVMVASASHPEFKKLSLFIVYLTEMDEGIPKVVYFQEIKGNPDITTCMETRDETTYVNQVKLCIPGETSRVASLFDTDGIFILHPKFAVSLFLPDDLEKGDNIPIIKSKIFGSHDQLIGYGFDEKFGYVMRTDAKTAALRILPGGFELTESDEINILDVIENLSIPSDSPESLELYNAFVEFCDKDLSRTTALSEKLSNLGDSELLKLVYNFIWNIFDDITEMMDVEIDLFEKRKFLDYFMLFLKHSELLNTVFAAKFHNPRVGRAMKGTELFSEFYERIEILLDLYKWKTVSHNHNDMLRHVGIHLSKEVRLREDGPRLAFKFTLLHLLPQITVNLCKLLLEKNVFKETAGRYEMISYSAELLLQLSASIKECRKIKNPIPQVGEGPKWTDKLVGEYNNMAMICVEELKATRYTTNEKAKMAQYVAKMIDFQISESGIKPNGHPVLRELNAIGEYRLALKLAEQYKDFNVMCRIALEQYFDDAIEGYKVRFAADDFEDYYLNYLHRKHMVKELLEQKGENAARFIAAHKGVRWLREIQEDQFGSAGQTLLQQWNKSKKGLKKQKYLLSMAKLSFFCADDNNNYDDELQEIEMTQNIIRYQESVPARFWSRVYPDNVDSLLSIPELLEICKMRLDDQLITLHEIRESLIFIARLNEEDSEEQTYKDARQYLWETVIKMDDWANEQSFHNTVFARLFNLVIEGDEELIKHSLPHTKKLLQTTAANRQKTPSSHQFIKYCIDEAKSDLE